MEIAIRRSASITIIIALVLAPFVLIGCTKVDDLAAPSCTYTVSPPSASVTAGGGAGSITVNATGVCGWTAAPQESWITITGGTSGQGAGTVTYSVQPNSNSQPR